MPTVVPGVMLTPSRIMAPAPINAPAPMRASPQIMAPGPMKQLSSITQSCSMTAPVLITTLAPMRQALTAARAIMAVPRPITAPGRRRYGGLAGGGLKPVEDGRARSQACAVAEAHGDKRLIAGGMALKCAVSAEIRRRKAGGGCVGVAGYGPGAFEHRHHGAGVAASAYEYEGFH